MLMDIIVWLSVGAIAGWLAGLVVKGGGFGLVGDIIVGIVGAGIAGWLVPLIYFPVIGPGIRCRATAGGVAGAVSCSCVVSMTAAPSLSGANDALCAAATMSRSGAGPM